MTSYSIKRILGVTFACILLSFIFQKNIFRTVSVGFFNSFQLDSQALVITGIIADEISLDKKGANIGFISIHEESGDWVTTIYENFSNKSDKENSSFIPYKSQYGLQGAFYSSLHKIKIFNKLSNLQFVPSLLLAITIIILFFLYGRIYDRRFSLFFLIGTIGSPWIVAFARNLYWSPFLWFLPAIFAGFLYITNNKYRKTLLLAITLSIFIKSLCGYEYLTSITLFTCSVFIIAPFFDKANQHPDYKLAVVVFSACVVGFILALLIHANMRGESIAEGLYNIYEQDVKRRTHGDPLSFDEVLKPSLSASVFEVIRVYVLNWKTAFLIGFSSKWFKILLVISLLGLFCKYKTKHPTFRRDIILFSFMLLIPISWFVLAKAHSYIHTHMNYVLWYIGFVPALLYVSMNAIIVIFTETIKWCKALDPQDY